MPFPRILPAAEADILAVRATTLADYGPEKLAEYDELLSTSRAPIRPSMTTAKRKSSFVEGAQVPAEAA